MGVEIVLAEGETAGMLYNPTSKAVGERGRNSEAIGLAAVWSTGESDDTMKESEIMEKGFRRALGRRSG